MKKTKNLLLVLLVFSVTAIGFYFFSYQKSPEYSLFLLQQSVREKDLPTFEKHVDLDSVLGNYFDDTIAKQTQEMIFEEKQMVFGFAKLFKNYFVTTTKESILKNFTAGEIPPSQTVTATAKEATEARGYFKNLAERLRPNKMEFRGTSNSKIQGDLASVELRMLDLKMEKEFVFIAQLSKLPDGTWQLIRITDKYNYFRELIEDKILNRGESDGKNERV